MKAQSNHAMSDALSLLQETAQSPFLTPAATDPRAEMADLEQLFLLNIQMRRRNLDRWISLLTVEVERRTAPARVRKQPRTRVTAPLRATA